jgi:hypothetical protein
VRLSGSVAALTLVMMSTACEREPSYTRVEPPPPSAPSPEFSGTLPSSMDTGGTAYYDFLQRVKRGQKFRVHMCTGFKSCWRKTDLVDVDLIPIDGSYKVNPRSVPNSGYLIMLATNLGAKQTQHYKLRPGPYLYSWYVYPDNPGASTSHWILRETDTTNRQTTLVAGERGEYHPCDDRAPATYDEAGLYECGAKHEVSAATKRSSLGAFGFLGTLWSAFQFELYPEPPDWKSCPAGCCTLLE